MILFFHLRTFFFLKKDLNQIYYIKRIDEKISVAWLMLLSGSAGL